MADSVTTSNKIIIVQGEDRELFFGLKDPEKEVFIDLTGVTEMEFLVAAAAGGTVSFTMGASEITITSATEGKFQLNASDVKTALMKVGELNVEVLVDWAAPTAGTRRIAQAEKAITVKKRFY